MLLHCDATEAKQTHTCLARALRECGHIGRAVPNCGVVGRVCCGVLRPAVACCGLLWGAVTCCAMQPLLGRVVASCGAHTTPVLSGRSGAAPHNKKPPTDLQLQSPAHDAPVYTRHTHTNTHTFTHTSAKAFTNTPAIHSHSVLYSVLTFTPHHAIAPTHWNSDISSHTCYLQSRSP